MHEVAKKALTELRWDDFFRNLNGIEERYQKEGLLREALKVARFQQDFERIKYIIKHNPILPDDLVCSAIDYLLELKQEDAVLNIAVLSNHQSQLNYLQKNMFAEKKSVFAEKKRKLLKKYFWSKRP